MDSDEYLTTQIWGFWGKANLGRYGLDQNQLSIGIPDLGARGTILIEYDPDISLDVVDETTEMYFDRKLQDLEICESEFPLLEKIFPQNLNQDKFFIEDVGEDKLAYHSTGPMVLVSQDGYIIDKIDDGFKKLSEGSTKKMVSFSNGDYLIVNKGVICSFILITSHEVKFKKLVGNQWTDFDPSKLNLM